jgi:hypothetical protein
VDEDWDGAASERRKGDGRKRIRRQ